MNAPAANRSFDLFDPHSRRPLAADTPHSLTDGERRWPVVEGIPYLRAGREALASEALDALDRRDETAALVLLLADQDDFAPLPPPSDADLRALLADPGASFREAMAALAFGPVADYFAHRWSAPTFLSGLALVALHAPPGMALVEVACGTGQLLREFAARGRRTLGIDLVFAKLWLGRRYLGVSQLVCAGAEALPVSAPFGAAVLAHDALYFLTDEAKRRALDEMTRVAAGGPVLAGHCHASDHPHGAGRAHPLTAAAWQALMPGANLCDDADLTRWFTSMGAHDVGPPLEPVAAISLARGERLSAPEAIFAPCDLPLRENPLLRPDGRGGLAPAWPTPAFHAEYADATYLEVADADAAARVSIAERHALRLLVPLPTSW